MHGQQRLMQRPIPAPVGRSALGQGNYPLPCEVRMPRAGLYTETCTVTPPYRPLERDRRLCHIEMQRLPSRSAGVAKYQLAFGYVLRNEPLEILPHILFSQNRQLLQVFAAPDVLRRQFQAFPALVIVRHALISMTGEMPDLFVL